MIYTEYLSSLAFPLAWQLDQIVSEHDYDFFCSIKPLYKKKTLK